jgi:nucleolin
MAGCLFVGDMSVCCRESHLLELFQEYGTVLKTEVRKNKEEFKFQGYGFVTMSSLEEAQAAMNGLNGLMVLGRKLK